jgi:hypothetical protein
MKRKARTSRPSRRARRSPETPSGLERLFTVDEIAATGVGCRAKLYKDIKFGRLQAKKFGRLTRITESAYKRYLEAAPALAL